MQWISWLLLALSPVLAHAELTVVTEEVPPYSYSENGEVTGLSTEVVRATLKRADLADTIQSYPWARALALAQSRPNVLIYPILRLPEREAEFQWIGAIGPRASYIYKLRSRSDIVLKTIEDARPFAIGGVRGDARIRYLESKGLKVALVSSREDLSIRQLVVGRIDLMVFNEQSLAFHAKALGYDEAMFEKAFFLSDFSKNDFEMAVSRGTDERLINRLRDALTQVKTSGDYARIVEKYLK